MWLLWAFFFLIFIGYCLRNNRPPEKDYTKIIEQRMRGHQAIDDLMTIVSVPIISFFVLCAIINWITGLLS